MGKKAVNEMTLFDLLAVLVLGTVISEPIVSTNLWIAAYFAIVIAVIYYLFSKLQLHNRFKKILNPSPTVLIRNGIIDYPALKKEMLTIEELIAQLRTKGYSAVTDIAMMTLETTGNFSILPTSDKRPLQASDIQVKPSPTFIDIPLIIDGQVIHHNLKYLELSNEWLISQLQAYNVGDHELNQISLATYNQQGFLSVSLKDVDTMKGSYGYNPGTNN